MTVNTHSVLEHANEKCIKAGVKLTAKRSQILEVLVSSGRPMSAYEVLDNYNANHDKAMPPTSAYRILDFLQAEQLVHKLESENKYIVCSHIACEHPHQVPQFLKCQKCSIVKEITINRQALDDLKARVSEAGYQLLNTQLELDCLCESCQPS